MGNKGNASVFSGSAPGKLMLLGEYAVLHGYPALVAAIDRAIHVSLTPRSDNAIHITSALGHYHTTLDHLTPTAPFTFVLATLRHFRSRLPSGSDITIHAAFSDQVGFGSSAATVVALCRALYHWLSESPDPMTLTATAQQIVSEAQAGKSSGADVVASVYGGLLYYHPTLNIIEALPHYPPITVLYSGYKTPTTTVISFVQARFQQRQSTFLHLCKQIAAVVETGKTATLSANWQALGTCLQEGQSLMRDLGVSDPQLEQCIRRLEADPGIVGAKISGSGLGDCVVGIGTAQQTLPSQLIVKIAALP